ncbi:CvpA family protein [Desulfospira joergensenii]|uniref:CvpA family protein n=1 Tax=Desulfospira joergensenii TaxID=53329 RepID=UPI0003B78041|nr:CvpA family protein [Desulfospira joergensenii]
MNGFDVLVLVILAVCLVLGSFKGLIREVSGIIGVIAAFYGANTYFNHLTPYLEDFIQAPWVRNLVCFFVLFCVILTLVGLLAALIRKFLHLVFLGWVDRSFGFVFGAAKGILIVSVIFIMFTVFIPGSGSYLAGSRTAPYLAKVSNAMIVFVSKGMKSDFFRQLKGMKTKWKQ